MASLAQTTQTTRKLLKWGGILFVIFLIIRLILFPLAASLYRGFFPKEPPPPESAFGSLPNIPFPQSPSTAGLTFSIQTTTATLPPTCAFGTCRENTDPTQPVNIPERVNVYKQASIAPTFSSYESAKEKVASLGFTGEGKAVSDVIYTWTHPKNPEREITFNTITNSFTLTTTIATPSAFFTGQPPALSTAINSAKTFLSSVSLLPKDIDDKKTKTSLFSYQGGAFVPATSLSSSDIVQVDFYRKPFSKLPILNPNPQQSLISLRVKKEGRPQLQVMEAHYAYKAFPDSPSTYPIITAQEAFETLQQGNAFIATLLEGRTNIAIRKVYIAYYEGNDEVGFLLPIFVFEGDDFLAFVEAIRE